jgi:prepilin-type processing-associated H-X9-DG protein
MENWYQGNSYRQIGQPGNRIAFSSRTLYGFHNKGLNCNVTFLDGHVEDIVAKKWATGNNRGIVFKDMHKRCIPNMK